MLRRLTPLEWIPFRKTSAPCHETPPGPTNYTIRHIYFLDLLLFHCNHKSKAKKWLSNLILPRPLLPWQFQVEWPVNSLAYWRTEPPVFSIILKMQSKPLRINHMWKERRMAWEKEWKSILNCINILTSKWIQANSSLVVTLIYEQLGIHINIVPLCLPLLNQGGLTRKVPSLKPENRLFLIAFHSFTYAFIPHMFSEYLSCAMH